MAHEIIWEDLGIYRRFWGMARATEYERVQSSAYADPRFDDLHYLLVDFSEVTGFVASVTDAENIVASSVGAAHSNPKLRVAVVVAHDELQALLNKVAHLSAHPLRLFSTLAEARAWLGESLPADQQSVVLG